MRNKETIVYVRVVKVIESLNLRVVSDLPDIWS